MNILRQLSLKNLKLNKKRTISTVIGIVLSCALICAVATLVTSFRQTLIENAINETGYYHIKISNVNDDDIRIFENNRDIKDVYTIRELGYGLLNKIKNEDKPYLKLYSMDKEVFEKLSFNLTQGRFPLNNNEIIISSHILSNGKADYKIGDKIKVNVGERRTLDDYILYSSNPYGKEDEKLVNTKEIEFAIVGIMERPNYNFEDYTDPGYTFITTNMDIGKTQAYISLKNPKEYKTSINELLGVEYNEDKGVGKGKAKYEEYSINRELLRWEAFAFSDSTVTMLYAVSCVVIFIIIFTSIFCIRNSFAIATTEKIKMYGMLASIGATTKQIKKNVIFEAMVFGIIGIPLGVISGIFAVFVLIKIVNMILGEYLLGHVDGIVLSVSILPILISVILGFVTIYLSAIASARKASRVSPIEGLRNLDEIKIKSRKLKTPKIISKVFKTGGVLAYKNLKRSKKKYRTTVVSLAISIFIFITMNSFITNMFNSTANYYKDYDYNVKIYGREKGISEDEIKKITSLDNIDESFILYEDRINYININDLSKINESSRFNLMEDSYYDEKQEKEVLTGEGKVSKIQLKALDDASFKKYAKKVGADYEKVKTSGILCDKYRYYDEDGDNTKEVRRYTYKENDIINGKYKDEQISIKVGAITDIMPYGIENNFYYGGYLIVNKDEYKDIDFTLDVLTVSSSKPDDFVSDMLNLKLDVGYTNLDAEVKQEKSMFMVIKIFLYGFITVITLIGVTNIFNTITSNMELRQKEFAMLKSIGMTRKEFNRMINLETIFYSCKSLIYGIILGLLGTFAMYKAFSVKIDKGVYIPFNAIIISAICVFILVFIIMRYSINKINKQNIIETIRKENI